MYESGAEGKSITELVLYNYYYYISSPAFCCSFLVGHKKYHVLSSMCKPRTPLKAPNLPSRKLLLLQYNIPPPRDEHKKPFSTILTLNDLDFFDKLIT